MKMVPENIQMSQIIITIIIIIVVVALLGQQASSDNSPRFIYSRLCFMTQDQLIMT
jgi:hypothetical protein